MKSNTLEIEYDSHLLAIIITDCKNNEIDVILLPEITRWLDENEISWNFINIWHTDNFPDRCGPRHSNLIFDNEQDMSAFILRWM